MRSKHWLVILSTVLLALPLTPPAAAQFLGQVTIATVQAQIASNLTCTGVAQNFITNQGILGFNNLGQTQHQVSATSAAPSFIMEIDGIDVLGNVVRISNPTVQFQPTILVIGYVAQGAGYYPNIQISVICTAGQTFSMTYSGSTGGSGLGLTGTPGQTPQIVPSLAADVQGLIPSGFNGVGVYPLITGAIQTPTNPPPLSTLGIDTFNTSQAAVGSGLTSAVSLFTPPRPSAPGEFAFMFYGPIIMVGTGSLAAPWGCVEDASCAVSSNSQLDSAFLNLYSTSQPLTINYVNSTASSPVAVSVAFAKAPTISLHATGSSNSQNFNPSLTPAGSTLLVAFSCTGTAACTPVAGAGGVTDTQGNPYRLVAFRPAASSGTTMTVYVYVGGPSSNAVDTITANMAAGSVGSMEIMALSGVTPAPLNTPSQPVFQSNNKAQSQEDDNGGIFQESSGFDYTQTVTLTPAGTTAFPLWAQPQNGLFYSCIVALRVTAASGTTPTLDTYVQDSGDNLGFNDRMHFPQATAAANYLGAVSGGVGGITPVVTTDGTMAVSTKLDGPLSAFGRIKFVVGGTTPSFTLTYNVACR